VLLDISAYFGKQMMTMMMMTSSHSMIPAMLATVWMLQLWNNLLLNTAGIFIQ